jgi:hypothetical protein
MEKARHNLDSYIDHGIFAFIPMIRADGVVPITIRTVESGGIWIENTHVRFGPGLTHSLSADEAFEPLQDMPPTVCFIPWHQIGYVLAGDTLDIPKGELLQLVPKGQKDA